VPLKLLTVAGARPNFIKIAPFLAAVRARQQAGWDATCSLVHTGQHYDANMSDIFFQELRIPAPDVHLAVGSGSQPAQTARIMAAVEPVLLERRPHWVVVFGDVTSTLACALVAAQLGIRVAHVEAGLRSFDRTMPEELNRILTDQLADLLFTPSADADEHLRHEGIPAARIRRVGNIMIDALRQNLPFARQKATCQRLGLTPGQFVYVTLHRPGNVDQPALLGAIFDLLHELAATLPVVLPLHPRTAQRLHDAHRQPGDWPRIRFLEPLGYHDSLQLSEHARLVITDSGGLQEETTAFGTPCLTLRPNTERPVTVTDGSNRLTTPETLAADLRTLLAGPTRIDRRPPLWDGHTAERIVDHLASA